MTTTRDALLDHAMTHVVVVLERALEQLLVKDEHTLSDALLATDLHEVIVTVHEVNVRMVDVDPEPHAPTIPEAVARAGEWMDSVPPDLRPLWLLALRGELASIQRGLA